ncbi:DUF3089 domain-containing protein [Hyphomicrobium sp.]|jgi:hypothetical protein|uniref:DUF3089 domain-containing protein n=1 Tax=Hyphomicrobium sp. TaxID=82 RepID=UPI00356145A8
MRFWRGLVGLLLLCLSLPPVMAAELKLRPPAKPFSAYPIPPAPDYADRASWAVWPGKPSSADVIPSGIDGTIPRAPKADVFFIHPTTFLDNSSWNAAFDAGGFTETQLDQGVLRHQASAFNGCCRIYVPRYRQATLSAFLTPSDDANKAFDLAYSDVLRAFDYFIAHANNGRPFIIASHSQGSLHATRLLQDRILRNPKLKRRLVAAYIIGASLPEAVNVGIPVCESARETGCIVDWNTTANHTILALGSRRMITFYDGKYNLVGSERWLCVNPLSWDRKTVSVPSANKAALPSGKPGEPLLPVVAGLTGARCDRDRLVVSIPVSKRKGFRDPMSVFGSYHNQDYNLFYGSIRQNAIDRVTAYTK